ncbi:MAG: hypothetical protein QXR62_04150 [Candidatus Bathyarchaeia archaeon]
MRKLTYILSALIAAILLMGIVYSLWSTSVVISGTINTGTVEGKWISAESDDIGIDPEWDKDVGYVEFEGLGTSELVVIVGNTYPCYTTTIVAIYEYTGTVPAIVNSTIVETIGWEPASSYGANDGPVFLEILYNVTVGTQLHQGDRIEVVIKVHVEQCAEQDASYLFTVEMELIQWNEYTPSIPPAEITTVTLHPNRGKDATDYWPYYLKECDLQKLSSSDDEKYQSHWPWPDDYNEYDYIDFMFPSIEFPSGATIESVVLYFEWTWGVWLSSGSAIDAARLQFYVGDTLYGTLDLNVPSAGTDSTVTVELMDYGIDTPEEVNGLRVRFQAQDGWGAQFTYHDLVELVVTYEYTP